jgi:LysM repeat protein
VVQAGDTLARIAQQSGVSLNNLALANPNIDFRRFKIGQRLVIPDLPQ